MLLEGKVALVTGSAGGIGLGIARRFAREGAKIVICDMDGDRLLEAAGAVEEDGGEPTSATMPTSSGCSIRRSIASARSTSWSTMP